MGNNVWETVKEKKREGVAEVRTVEKGMQWQTDEEISEDREEPCGEGQI